MSGRYLLDTNIVIALFAREAPIIERLEQAQEVFVPCMTLGELYYGAHRSERVTQNLAKIAEFAASSSILPCSAETAREYGAIKNALRAKGTPIPENDIWIAAVARQYDLVLVTRDRHFDVIENLKGEVW